MSAVNHEIVDNNLQPRKFCQTVGNVEETRDLVLDLPAVDETYVKN